MDILSMENISVRFGGLTALNEISFNIQQGEIIGLIGPNGAGKTTIFNVITGVYHPSEGQVRFMGQDILGLRPHQILAKGIARTFQNIRLFTNMTALENAMVALHARSKSGVLGAILHTPHQQLEERAIRNKALSALDFMGLAEQADLVAQNLPYGLQRKLEIARALASGPKLLLLDEPAAGMNPVETEELIKLIAKIVDQGISVLLVEHDMKVVMEICQRIVVIDHGQMIAQGGPKEIQKDPKVIEAYLGQPTQTKEV